MINADGKKLLLSNATPISDLKKNLANSVKGNYHFIKIANAPANEVSNSFMPKRGSLGTIRMGP